MAGIGLVGLLPLVVVCLFAHRQLLPLRTLTRTAEHISQGHYDLRPKASRRTRWTAADHFQMMCSRWPGISASWSGQRLAASNSVGQKELKAPIRRRRSDLMKTTFLHNMTNQR